MICEAVEAGEGLGGEGLAEFAGEFLGVGVADTEGDERADIAEDGGPDAWEFLPLCLAPALALDISSNVLALLESTSTSKSKSTSKKEEGDSGGLGLVHS
jgi:hypothetical protein